MLKAASLPQIMAAHEYCGRFNLDGFLMYNQVYEPNTRRFAVPTRTLFRSGSIEAVHVLDHPLGDFISQTFEPIFAQAFEYYIHQMKVLGLGPPIFVLISLLWLRAITYGSITMNSLGDSRRKRELTF
jgi:hypothetical protein